MPLSLCTGLTHPTTLSFGTLQILLPALANLANVLSFLFLLICDSSPPSKSNLPQMKSLRTSFFNSSFPGTKESLRISEFPFLGWPHCHSYYFTTTFSSLLRTATWLFVPHSSLPHFGPCFIFWSIFNSGKSTTRLPQTKRTLKLGMHCLMLPVLQWLLDLSWMRTVNNAEEKWALLTVLSGPVGIWEVLQRSTIPM